MFAKLNGYTEVLQLTEEQQEIVRHDQGPALVFAVAGSGKTTSMVNRIRHLVHDRKVASRHILASSFSRATVAEIQVKLTTLQVTGVDCRTLHSLGLKLIRLAEDRSFWTKQTNEQDINPNLNTILAERALKRMARERNCDVFALGIDVDELESQISSWKQNLAYYDLDDADLPYHISTSAFQVMDAQQDSVQIYQLQGKPLVQATQAEHPNPDFILLYQYYEEERQGNNWITFDDMLIKGWEALVRFPEVRSLAQGMYRYVLIDEFQDVSLVQYLILDIITEKNRNYMVIGDDDQCIYTWRGANPKYFLDFKRVYQAKEYLITENFRSPAQQTTLANSLIAHNQHRKSKQINLTQGFHGATQIVSCDDSFQMAECIVKEIRALQSQDWRTNEMVVLVRSYAQTPFIEAALIEHQIPYQIQGNQPFYKRSEISTLLSYLYWAQLERKVQANEWFKSRTEQLHYVNRFQRIIQIPARYIKREIIEEVCAKATRQKTSIIDPLMALMMRMHNRTRHQVEDFITMIEQLMNRLDQPANETLAWLVDTLDYQEYLRKHSAMEELGESKVQTVSALISFADGHQTCPDLLEYVKKISFGRLDEDADEDWLKITSIHRAKGLEWPIVFIPNCNEGVVPVRKATYPANSLFDSLSANEPVPEEERRLFYVAITRSRKMLYLLSERTRRPSQFLEEARAEDLVNTCNRIKTALSKPTTDLSQEDVIPVCMGIEEATGLQCYFSDWWKPDFDFKDRFNFLLGELESRIGEIEIEQDKPDVLVDRAMINGTRLERKLSLNDLSIDQLIWHQQFGHGQIIAINESNQEIRIMVRFDTVGYKTLMAQYTHLYTSQDNGKQLDHAKTHAGVIPLPIVQNNPLGVIKNRLVQGLNFFKALLS